MTNEMARKKLNTLMLIPGLQGTDFLTALALGMKALDDTHKCHGCRVWHTGVGHKICATCSRSYDDRFEEYKGDGDES